MLANRAMTGPSVQRQAAARTAFQGVRVSGRCVAAPARRAQAATTVCQASAAPVPYKGDLLNDTYYPTSADAASGNKRWYVIDAKGQTLGRLASLAATYIRGKHLPTYQPSMDMGAFVVVLNASHVAVSGKKAEQKTYFRHVNGRPGSYRIESYRTLQARVPERIVEHAVQGMLPKNRLGRDIKLHLKVYAGTEHPSRFLGSMPCTACSTMGSAFLPLTATWEAFSTTTKAPMSMEGW